LKLPLFFILFIFLTAAAVGQVPDTTNKLNQVVIKGYYNPQSLLRAVSATSVIDSNTLKNQQDFSLVGALNTAPGIRMEERSPGSYRLSIRGSLLRSPFGIRNIKIYIDDFPLTDAGGNTYLNALDVAAVGTIEVYKGPEASIFGANTGGAVLVDTRLPLSNTIGTVLTAGSYGSFHQTVHLEHIFTDYKFTITAGYQQSDGYRANSALKRKYIQTVHEWNYSARGKLKAFFFYSDLNYETPGGLTAIQLSADPKSARPATATLPGAEAQQAAIFNQTAFAGLSNTYQIGTNWKHVIAVFASHTDFENPFITNYEKRKENTLGIRSFLTYDLRRNSYKADLQVGLEASRTKSDIENFNNDRGTATSLQANDKLSADQEFAFLKINLDFNSRLLIEVGSSLNFFGYAYQQFHPALISKQQRQFDKQLMPKIAASYLFGRQITARASIGRGYSPPTLAEVRSSDNIINDNIQAESGWNYEIGSRYQSLNNRFSIDANAFYFNLKDAIVRRLNNNDIEYFVNAGGTKQFGTELQVAGWPVRQQGNHFLRAIQLSSSFTYSHFRFDNFSNAAQNYTGNRLTGVPKNVLVSSAQFNFTKGFFLFMQHNYTAKIPLNDANTAFAKSYHLADLKTGIRDLKFGKTKFDFSFGINNLFDQQYSLGNDLNAASNRFFNPAARINYYTSLAVQLFQAN
jgi:iron complex outermembrane receptor protein